MGDGEESVAEIGMVSGGFTGAGSLVRAARVPICLKPSGVGVGERCWLGGGGGDGVGDGEAEKNGVGGDSISSGRK
uniref:DUF834 domain-containing protein n=1 Tax=Oryza punctata TaxID=4537 RepID=A0A0E0M578_ORYPU